MKDEIKEIIDNVKKCCDIMEDNNFVVYQKQDILKLLDYITNLQEIADVYNRKYREVKMLKEQLLYEKENTKDYKSRNEKAIEYINKNKNKTIAPYGDNEDTDYEICLFEEDIAILLNILQEVDNNEN